jgi:hypothetical protein
MISNTNDNSMSVGTSGRSHREIQIDCNFVVPSLEPEQLISRSYPTESLHGGGTLVETVVPTTIVLMLTQYFHT